MDKTSPVLTMKIEVNYDDLENLCILIMLPMSYNLMMSATLKTFKNVSSKKKSNSPEEDFNKPVYLLNLYSWAQLCNVKAPKICPTQSELVSPLSNLSAIWFSYFHRDSQKWQNYSNFPQTDQICYFAVNPTLQCESSPEMFHAITIVLIFIKMIKFVIFICHMILIFSSCLLNLQQLLF